MEMNIDYNIMEEILRLKLDEIQLHLTSCTCDQCKEEIIELALKKLPPIYASNPQDYLIQKTAILDFQFNADIIIALIQSSQELSTQDFSSELHT